MARPAEYSNEVINKTKEYLALCGDVYYEVKQKPKLKDGVHIGTEDVVVTKTKLPTIEGLAVYLGIHRDTIYDWESQEDKKEFSDIISELRQRQADMLINNGLTGDYSPVIAKVLLTKHGYREGVENTGLNGKDLIPESITKEQKQKLDSLLDVNQTSTQ